VVDPTASEVSFAPVVDGVNVVFGAANFNGVLTEDLPVSSLATVSLVSKSIMIKNARGVRAFEIVLKFPDTGFSNFTFVRSDFITKSPAESEGLLATMNWTGTSAPIIVSVILTDANGGNIAALME